jgi:hypothetical protein
MFDTVRNQTVAAFLHWPRASEGESPTPRISAILPKCLTPPSRYRRSDWRIDVPFNI